MQPPDLDPGIVIRQAVGINQFHIIHSFLFVLLFPSDLLGDFLLFRHFPHLPKIQKSQKPRGSWPVNSCYGITIRPAVFGKRRTAAGW